MMKFVQRQQQPSPPSLLLSQMLIIPTLLSLLLLLLLLSSPVVVVHAFVVVPTVCSKTKQQQQPVVIIHHHHSARKKYQHVQQHSINVLLHATNTETVDDDDKATTTTTTTTVTLPTRTEEIRRDADGALASVGWSMPSEGDLTSDDPFVKAIDASIRKDYGVPLDELLNPAKVVNLERDLYTSRIQLAEITGMKDTLDLEGVRFLNTADCDGGGGGDGADVLRKTIAKKEADLIIERRSVFQGWLKNIFLIQAVLSLGLSYVMATNPSSLFGQYDWFYAYNMDISISVLGYWWWWLFVVPSLRSRRPKGNEKKALDIAFVGTPLISLLAPVLTKDTAIIWFANLLVVAASYAFAYTVPDNDDDSDDTDDDASKTTTPGWLKFVFKSLDFGSGRERGSRQ